MRVDWCVSSWFRIKNTHSLTPGPCIVRARGAREHEQDAPTCWWLPVSCCLILTILVGLSFGAKSQNLSARRGNLIVVGDSDRPT